MDVFYCSQVMVVEEVVVVAAVGVDEVETEEISSATSATAWAILPVIAPRVAAAADPHATTATKLAISLASVPSLPGVGAVVAEAVAVVDDRLDHVTIAINLATFLVIALREAVVVEAVAEGIATTAARAVT